jgi:hypothetical protein
MTSLSDRSEASAADLNSYTTRRKLDQERQIEKRN